MTGQEAYNIYRSHLKGRTHCWYTLKENSTKYQDKSPEAFDAYVRQVKKKYIDKYLLPENFSELPERQQWGWHAFAEYIIANPDEVAEAWEEYAMALDIEYFSERTIPEFAMLSDHEQAALNEISHALGTMCTLKY